MHSASWPASIHLWVLLCPADFPGPSTIIKDIPDTLTTQRITKILGVLFQDLVTKTKISVSYYEPQYHTFKKPRWGFKWVIFFFLNSSESILLSLNFNHCYWEVCLQSWGVDTRQILRNVPSAPALGDLTLNLWSDSRVLFHSFWGLCRSVVRSIWGTLNMQICILKVLKCQPSFHPLCLSASRRFSLLKVLFNPCCAYFLWGNMRGAGYWTSSLTI